LLPKVYIDPQTFQNLCTPWKDALVVKLLGKNIGYTTMKDRLHKVWKLQGGFEIMDNDNGFYMVKFDQAADKEKVITGGPWMIFDHCLAVNHWSPEFASPDAKVNRTVVWIRFPGLNLVYYDESFLLAMASAIGRPIKVDTNTLKVERGKFARVCVEVDLTVPVVGKIWVNGHWYKVQYEGLHIICTSCGCYGHVGRNCTQKPPVTATEPSVQQPAATGNNSSTHNTTSVQEPFNADSGSGNAMNANQEIPQTAQDTIISINEGTKEIHGDWLLVTRKKKQTHNPSSKTSAKPTNLSHANKPLLNSPNFPPRPKPHEINRAQTSHSDPKRRRQDDTAYPPMNAQSLAFNAQLSKKIPSRNKPSNATPATSAPSTSLTPQPTMNKHTTPHKPTNTQPHTQEEITISSNPNLKPKPVETRIQNTTHTSSTMISPNITEDARMNCTDTHDNLSSPCEEDMVT
ncbi:hypothetical protein A2U01_0003044, partial [Trifolium medium]|nr:hypothetical protein [Trifolium medium]